MFYRQNCSGRLKEMKTIISVARAKNDFNFHRFIKELNLINCIKKELNEKSLFLALELTKKYNLYVSLVVKTKQFNLLKKKKKKLVNYSNWFVKLYGLICYITIKPIFDMNIKSYLYMDREYDKNTLNIVAKTISLFARNCEISVRKKRKFPLNRIVIADLFARGYFKEYNCNSLLINNKLKIENEITKVFKNCQ